MVPLANPLTLCSSCWRSGKRKKELWNFITPGPPLMQLSSYSERSYLDKQHNEKDWLFLAKTAQATTMNTRWRWITSIMGSCVLETFSICGQSLIHVKTQMSLQYLKKSTRKIIITCLSVGEKKCLGFILFLKFPMLLPRTWLLLKKMFGSLLSHHALYYKTVAFLASQDW